VKRYETYYTTVNSINHANNIPVFSRKSIIIFLTEAVAMVIRSKRSYDSEPYGHLGRGFEFHLVYVVLCKWRPCD
jgi:hypothetical protein